MQTWKGSYLDRTVGALSLMDSSAAKGSKRVSSESSPSAMSQLVAPSTARADRRKSSMLESAVTPLLRPPCSKSQTCRHAQPWHSNELDPICV